MQKIIDRNMQFFISNLPLSSPNALNPTGLLSRLTIVPVAAQIRKGQALECNFYSTTPATNEVISSSLPVDSAFVPSQARNAGRSPYVLPWHFSRRRGGPPGPETYCHGRRPREPRTSEASLLNELCGGGYDVVPGSQHGRIRLLLRLPARGRATYPKAALLMTCLEVTESLASDRAAAAIRRLGRPRAGARGAVA